MKSPATTLTLAAAFAVALALAASAEAGTTTALVTVGSPPDRTPQNVQSEPALAIDAAQPNILAAGVNDLIDFRRCPPSTAPNQAGTCFDRTTPVDFGVGLSGVYFSFDRGRSWIQPTYSGITARDCDPTGPCPARHIGPIGTLPWYAENGLISHGDPAVAFGPRPVNGHFSWANGARLYYANLVTQLLEDRFFPITEPFAGLFDIAVSRLDSPTPSSVLDKNSWLPPVIAMPHTSVTTFEDKDQIWVDNAASSPYFGNVYVCADELRSLLISHGRGNAATEVVAISSDGGDTWTKRQVAGAATNTAQGTKIACTIRTDSNGVVYLFYTRFGIGTSVGTQVMQKSFDGGDNWTRPQDVFEINDACFNFDAIEGDCVGDGYSGARTGISAAPSVDIANGAPTGVGATNEIVDAWSDGRLGLNDEKTFISVSTNGGATWSGPATVSLAGDRSFYSAAAISPTGDRVYLVYEGAHTPWQGADMTTPRPYHGVFRTAPIAADGTVGAWSTLENGPLADLRASYPGHDIYQERIGDYVYAAATRTYGAAVWTDLRNAAVCEPVQLWRGASLAAGARAPGAPWPLSDCPSRWGNADIYAATTG
jgi:hypothetical protein